MERECAGGCASGKKIETHVCATKGARLTRAHALPLCIQPPRFDSPSRTLSLSLSLFPSFVIPLYLAHVSASEIYLAMRERETPDLHACRCM